VWGLLGETSEAWISEDEAVMAGVVAEERKRRGRWDLGEDDDLWLDDESRRGVV